MNREGCSLQPGITKHDLFLQHFYEMFFPFLPNFVEMPSLFLQKFNIIWLQNTRQANRISVLFNSTLLLSPLTNLLFKRFKTNFPSRNVLPFDIFGYSLKPSLKHRNVIQYLQVKTTYSLKTAFLLAQPKMQECFHFPLKRKMISRSKSHL